MQTENIFKTFLLPTLSQNLHLSMYLRLRSHENTRTALILSCSGALPRFGPQIWVFESNSEAIRLCVVCCTHTFITIFHLTLYRECAVCYSYCYSLVVTAVCMFLVFDVCVWCSDGILKNFVARICKKKVNYIHIEL